MKKTPKSIRNVIFVKLLRNVKDFSKFEILEDGKKRKIDEKHVQDLMESMKLYGTEASTCIIIQTSAFGGKKKLVRADGNHRMVACERLGLGIDCKIMRLTNDTQVNVLLFIAQFNNTSKAWSTKNYVESFSSIGVTEYQKFEHLQKTHGLKVTDLQIIFNVTPKEFKSGKMQFPNEEESEKLLDAIVKVLPIVPNKAFTRRSLYKVMRISNNYDKLANQIIKTYDVKGIKFPENEHDFYGELLIIYQKIK